MKNLVKNFNFPTNPSESTEEQAFTFLFKHVILIVTNHTEQTQLVKTNQQMTDFIGVNIKETECCHWTHLSHLQKSKHSLKSI